MASKVYEVKVCGHWFYVTPTVDADGRPEWEVREQESNKTFTTRWEPDHMLLRAICSPIAVFIGHDPNIELAVGFPTEEMAWVWMSSLCEEDKKNAHFIYTEGYCQDYRYLG